MRRITGAIFAGLLLIPALTSPAMTSSAMADEAELAAILFGRNYNDGVTAICVWHCRFERLAGGPVMPTSHNSARMRVAQSEDYSVPDVRVAIDWLNIALHNVVWVQTAAYGGRILYYRKALFLS